MAEFWKSKDFKKLSQEWEEKLKESGFEDAEKTIGNDRHLKTPSLCLIQRRGKKDIGFSQVVMEAKQNYFLMILDNLQREKFESETDKLIMERIAAGKKIKDISEELKALLPDGKKRSKFNRNTIRYVRRRYENKWGIRVWNPIEMVSRKPRLR